MSCLLKFPHLQKKNTSKLMSVLKIYANFKLHNSTIPRFIHFLTQYISNILSPFYNMLCWLCQSYNKFQAGNGSPHITTLHIEYFLPPGNCFCTQLILSIDKNVLINIFDKTNSTAEKRRKKKLRTNNIELYETSDIFVFSFFFFFAKIHVCNVLYLPH